MKTAACSVTYLFGGEFYQGSFIALKGGKRKCQKCEMRHFLPEERRLCSSTHMKGRQESCTNRGLRGAATHARVSLNPSSAFCIVALMISQQRQPPSSAHLWKPSLTWEMDFWTDYSKINCTQSGGCNKCTGGFFPPSSEGVLERIHRENEMIYRFLASLLLHNTCAESNAQYVSPRCLLTQSRIYSLSCRNNSVFIPSALTKSKEQ